MFAVTEGPTIENIVELAQLQIEQNLWGGARCDVPVSYWAVDIGGREENTGIPDYWLWLQASQKWAMLFTIHTGPLHSNVKSYY